MYRLPRETDLSFLLGAGLLQVCVGMNEVVLHFDREIRITVMADFAVARGGAELVRHDDTRRGAPDLLWALHDAVATAAATDGGGLELAFRSGIRFVAYDDSDQFESFLIENGEHLIVV